MWYDVKHIQSTYCFLLQAAHLLFLYLMDNLQSPVDQDFSVQLLTGRLHLILTLVLLEEKPRLACRYSVSDFSSIICKKRWQISSLNRVFLSVFCLTVLSYTDVMLTVMLCHTAPCGGEIEPVVYQTSNTSYSVTWTPEEPGKIISHCFIIFKIALSICSDWR